jgi:hypothetical protein
MTAPIPPFPPVTLAPRPAPVPREAPPTEPPIEIPPVARRPLWNLVIQDQAGIIQPGARVTVLLAGTSTLASLWAFDDVTPVANPASADGEGRLSVRLAAGLYDLGITGAGGTRWLRELLATTVATQVVAAKGDLIIGSEVGVPARRVAGPEGALLVMVQGFPTWGVMPTEATVLGSDGAYPAWVPRGTAPEGSVLLLQAGAPVWGAPPAPLSAIAGRLTTEPGVPVSINDRLAQPAVYFTPYAGASIPLFDGTYWRATPLTEVTISLTNLAVGVYDLFAYRDAGGAVAVDAPVAWAASTARAVALGTQDGVSVKAGDPTRRYIGTVATTALGQTEDSHAKRMVWNAQNRRPRPVRRFETATSWTYTVENTWRQANANAANQIAIVVGLLEAPIRLALTMNGAHSVANGRIAAAIGEDATTAPMAASPIAGQANGASGWSSVHVALDALPTTVGQHAYAWLEAMSLAGTATYYNDPAGLTRSGLTGEVWT